MVLPSVNKVTKTEIHAAQALTIVAEPKFNEVNTIFFVHDLYYVIRITDLWNWQMHVTAPHTDHMSAEQILHCT